MPDEKNTLKPCPFCGSKNVVSTHYYPFDGDQGESGVFVVYCVNCKAKVDRGSANDAEEAWNRRVNDE